MATGSDRPEASSAEVHVLFAGYVNFTTAVGRVASTVAFVRDGEVLLSKSCVV
jgi:hypothetical protein